MDDSDSFRALLADVAAAAELDVVATAASGEEAVALVGEPRPDVVIVDVRLPGMSGFAVADRVRARSDGTQVIAVSAADGGRDGRVIPKRSLTPGLLRAILGLGVPLGEAHGGPAAIVDNL